MSRSLIAFVTVHPEAGERLTYGPGDDIPAAHAALIDNVDAWDGPAAPKPTRASGK